MYLNRQVMDHTFRYSSLPQGYIRVLHVQRLSNEAVYTLQHEKLDGDLRFRAISYAWGSTAKTHSIRCNSAGLPVTASVFHLLCSTVVSQLGEGTPLWIDAICINQTDALEKAEQVRQMCLVYSLAMEVIIWLGPTSSDSDRAMETLYTLSQLKAVISKDNASDFANSRDTLHKVGLDNETDDLRCALGSLYCRGWFQRVWPFQEVVLARERRVVCGPKVIDWDDFVAASETVHRLFMNHFSLIYPNPVAGVQALEGVVDMSKVVRHIKLATDELRFAALLDVAQRRIVTDSRDRVYGMLGISSARVRSLINVDYSQEGDEALLRLYIDAGKVCIQQDASLSLLYMLSGREKKLGLPSWCPNLGSHQVRRLFVHPKWKAGIPTNPGGEQLPYAWFEPEDDDLYAPGCTLDMVREVVSSTFSWLDIMRGPEEPTMEDAINNLAWQEECYTLFQETYQHQGGIPISYIMTLSEGFLSNAEEDPHIIHQAYELMVSSWRDRRDGQEPAPHQETDQRVRAALHGFQSRLSQNCEGRKFFSTDSGRVGVGPPDTQAGDTVCILYGAGPLYLLRFGDEATRILGNVYIHDLMSLDETPEELKGENMIFVVN